MPAAMELGDFIPISVATLVPSEADAGVDLFRCDATGENLVLFRGSSHPLSSNDIKELQEAGLHSLYINRGSLDRYQSYLRELVGLDGAGSDAPLAARVGALNEVVRDILDTAFRSGDTDQATQAAKQLGKVAAEIICHDKVTEADLFRVLHHDYATFTHCANVALYAGLLARELGHSASDIRDIITGGLLHDLGKLDVDERILCKPGRLTDQEYREVQRHPILGLQKLAHRSDLNEGQLMMVYQHHERIDGSGYPVGLVGDEIHPWAKLCGVVDVFEALTSHRPYRRPKPKNLVLELLHRSSAKAFDSEILACWVSITRTFWRS